MNRTYDLKKTLPDILAAANASPPVAIVVLDYSSADDLESYMLEIIRSAKLVAGNYITFASSPDHQFYNSPPARNLSVLCSSGEYFVMMATDMLPDVSLVEVVRQIIEREQPVWMCENWLGRLIVCRRDEFIAAGGYDERFDCYAPEDKDICMRLHRRGGKFVSLSPKLVTEIYTPNSEKLKNLDPRYLGSKREMANVMQPIYDDNNARGVLVANPDGWGKW
jgi:hypothetical protein